MWTEIVESAPGTVTQVRGSAQALIRFAKTTRRRRHSGRPRHQGRPDRRPARGRAHGRRGAVVRGRRRAASSASCARVKNRFGADRRDRRLRNDRARPARGRQPVRAVSVRARSRQRRAPPCSPASRARGRCWWKFRRWSRRPRSARRAAPWSAGTRAGWPWCWRCWRPIAAVRLGQHDVYLNVAGGLRIHEPAADLAAAAALVSSLATCALPADAVYFGEIALSGAVRPVAQAAARLKEAAKLGFRRATSAGRLGARRGEGVAARKASLCAIARMLPTSSRDIAGRAARR